MDEQTGGKGKTNIGKHLGFPYSFDLLPKRKFAKNKKHQKQIFNVQNVACFWLFFLRIMEIVVAGSEGRMMRSQGYGSGLCIP